MSASLKKSQGHFTAVVEQKRQLGLDQKSSLEGRLRASVHGIEVQIDQLQEQALLITMLMMRRHEKDFMLCRDRKYGDDMKKRSAEFVAGIEKAAIPEAARAELKQKLAAAGFAICRRHRTGRTAIIFGRSKPPTQQTLLKPHPAS